MTSPSLSIQHAQDAPTVLRPTASTERRFLRLVFVVALAARLTLVAVLRATDAVYNLRLSPDSERYHRDAIEINEYLSRGMTVPYRWEDDAWFRFTALVYRVFGNHSIIIQLLNVVLGALTAVLAYHLALRVSRNEVVARIAGLITALNPALIYWSCLMLKDPVSAAAMTALVTAAVELRHRFSMRWLAFATLSMLVFFGVRSYMFLILGALFMASLVLFRRLNSLGSFGTFLAGGVMAFGLPMALGYGPLGIEFYRDSHYFNLDYINHVRVAMGDHGNGRIFEGEVAIWTDDMLSNAVAAVRTAFFFFFVLDLSNLSSTRQLMALPEALFILACFPAFLAGVLQSWRGRRHAIPLLLFGAGVMSVYIAGTTNMGALFRWKMQVMPILGVLIAIGLVARRDIRLYDRVVRRVSAIGRSRHGQGASQ